jgi:hypothetical protein
MSSKIRVGDRLTLPSGKTVSIAIDADPRRPWRPHGMGTMWAVRREQRPGQVHREPWEYYTGNDTAALWLVESDAAALAFELNRACPAKRANAPGQFPRAAP